MTNSASGTVVDNNQACPDETTNEQSHLLMMDDVHQYHDSFEREHPERVDDDDNDHNDNNNHDGHGDLQQHDEHHDHHSRRLHESVPLYANPKQRQRWDDMQMMYVRVVHKS